MHSRELKLRTSSCQTMIIMYAKIKTATGKVKKQDSIWASVSAPPQKEAFERIRDLAKKAESEVSIHRG